jgi:hypothetical protein
MCDYILTWIGMVVQRRFPTGDIIDVLFFARNKNLVEFLVEQPQAPSEE